MAAGDAKTLKCSTLHIDARDTDATPRSARQVILSGLRSHAFNPNRSIFFIAFLPLGTKQAFVER
jgi:threonine/homoserine/homoserine lactone efflux protein